MFGFRAKLASPASAGILFVVTLVADAACLPLAVLARQAAGNNLIFLAAVVLLALVLGGVGAVVARHQPGNPMAGCSSVPGCASLWARTPRSTRHSRTGCIQGGFRWAGWLRR